MATPRILHLDLTRAPMQPAAPLPPVCLTPGTRALLPQLAEGVDLLPKAYEHFSQLVVGRSSSRDPAIICTTVAELPVVAAAQGFMANPKGMQHLVILHEQVLAARTVQSYWLPPVRRISQFLTHPTEPQLPWFIYVLPANLRLALHGVTQHGMTWSPHYDRMYFGVETMTEQALLREGPPVTSQHIETYLSGALWNNNPDPIDTLLPVSVILHEAAHVAHKAFLRQWIDRNAARDSSNRNPAFVRHCQTGPDGNVQVDFAFATLFLELAALLATGTYFNMMQSALPQDQDISLQVATSLSMAFVYVTNPRFTPFLTQAGIPLPTTSDDIRGLVAAMKQWTAIVFGDD